MSLKVAIIGRPNVGKSTLFNRLAGKQLALVDDRPGVTRDRREGAARIGDLRLRIIDTAGLETEGDDSLEGRMRRQTESALAEADVGLFLIDARAGVTPLDAHFARWLRRQKTPVILVANKCEGRVGLAGQGEAYSLGFGDPLPVSAMDGFGLDHLYEALKPFADAKSDDAPLDSASDGPMQFIVVGRPNVGKSTLINRLLGQDRVLTGPEPGVTRDAIGIEWSYRGRPIRMVDTAGLRRRAQVTDRLEKMSAEDTKRAIRYGHVVVLVLDARVMLEKQDLTIARSVIDEGRALIVVANKWDVVEDPAEALAALRERLETSLSQVRGVTFVTLSALTGRHTDKLLPAIIKAYDVWNKRVSTGALNRWLAAVIEQHPPPLVSGRYNKLRYITQVKARPPTFALFAGRPHDLPASYLRYLENNLRDAFGLDGTPIRITLRKGKNPYVDEDK